jgi:uncharacterized protein YfiM (DUF2279 family)
MNRQKRLYCGSVATGWMTVIFLTSCTRVTKDALVGAVAQSKIAGSEQWFEAFWERYWFVFVKGYHVMEFAVLMALCYLTLREYARYRLAIGLSMMFSIAYAASDEWYQTFTPYRGGRATDVVIDTAGIALAAGVIAWVARRNEIKRRTAIPAEDG